MGLQIVRDQSRIGERVGNITLEGKVEIVDVQPVVCEVRQSGEYQCRQYETSKPLLSVHRWSLEKVERNQEGTVTGYRVVCGTGQYVYWDVYFNREYVTVK